MVHHGGIFVLMVVVVSGADVMPPGKTTRGSPVKGNKSRIPCYDPGTMELLGYVPAMTPAQVRRSPCY